VSQTEINSITKTDVFQECIIAEYCCQHFRPPPYYVKERPLQAGKTVLFCKYFWPRNNLLLSLEAKL